MIATAHRCPDPDDTDASWARSFELAVDATVALKTIAYSIG
jgi:hypothetical protein